MRSLAQIAVKVKALHPEDSVGTAAEAIRSATVGALPVVRSGQLLGVLTAHALSEQPSDSPYRTLPLTQVFKNARVADLRLDYPLPLRDTMSPAAALEVMQDTDLECAPVIDGTGVLIGMVTRADLVSAMCGRIRPPVVGGMATPFGVYLTGGGARGGVSDLALMSTGIYMVLMLLSAAWCADLLAGSDGWLYRVPAIGSWLLRVPSDIVPMVVMFLLYGLFFRLSRIITGYHAAEHQVVHAIEAGDELLPEVVREKPRVHPRCGTNLVVAVAIMSFFWYGRGEVSLLDQLQPVAGMLITFLLWKRIGGWVQQHVTTGPASRKQIDSGIRAAKELIAQYQTGTGYRSPFHRIWNMGLLQVLGGASTVYMALMLLEWLHAPIPAVFH